MSPSNKLALLSFLFVVLLVTLNFIREGLFLVPPGYAPREFTYLLLVTVPLATIATVLSTLAIGRETARSISKNRMITKEIIITWLLALPGLIIGLLFAFILVDIVMS